MKPFTQKDPVSEKRESPSTSDDRAVKGERDETVVNRAASVQSRISRVLALGLIAVLGLGVLVWYYSNAIHRQTQARVAAKAQVSDRVRGEMDLPSLGRIDPPLVPVQAAAHGESAFGDKASTPPPQDKSPEASQYSAELPQMLESYSASGAVPPAYGAQTQKTPAQLALERRLSGVAFARSTGGLPEPLSGTVGDSQTESAGGGSAMDGERAPQREGTLATLLRPTVNPAARARIVPTQQFLLPKGAFIDCTLETAIDSTLPGMTTCITATDTFGADGKVVLLERGSKLIGETRAQVQQGSNRVFVLWTEARTPTGVIVPLDSPGTDELGRSGLPGKVNRHFWDRFGAAILISVIDGAIQAKVQSASNGGTVIYNPSSTQDIMTEVLKGTINIPPTVVKPQGDRIQVLVARDLDFRSVYELRSSVAGR